MVWREEGRGSREGCNTPGLEQAAQALETFKTHLVMFLCGLSRILSPQALDAGAKELREAKIEHKASANTGLAKRFYTGVRTEWEAFPGFVLQRHR